MDKLNIEALVEHAFANEFNHTLHAYIDITEDLVAGTLLSQIMFWFSADKDGKRKVRIVKDGEYWLAKKRNDWHSEIRISPKQYDRAVKILVDKGLVEVKKFKFNGDPTTHIRPIYENLAKAIRVWKQKRAEIIVKANFTDGEIPTESKVHEVANPNFTEGVSSNFTFGEEPNLPNGNNQLHERDNSLTEITTEITSETTDKKNESIKKSATEKSETERKVLYEGQSYHDKTEKSKKVKHKYGEFQKVMLTDDEYNKLLAKHGEELLREIITFFDEYIEEKGYKSKSHYLAIGRWVVDAVEERRKKKGGGKNGQPAKHTQDPFADAHWNRVL